MARNLLKNPNGEGKIYRYLCRVSFCLSKAQRPVVFPILMQFPLDGRDDGFLGPDGERWNPVVRGGHARRLWT